MASETRDTEPKSIKFQTDLRLIALALQEKRESKKVKEDNSHQKECCGHCS